MVNFSSFEGMTFSKVDISDNCIVFVADNGARYIMQHIQDCCENVYLADQIGSWDDIIGHKIMSAYKKSEGQDLRYGHRTYTFYTLATMRGCMTLRWCGESNGYYSESVDIYKG